MGRLGQHKSVRLFLLATSLTLLAGCSSLQGINHLPAAEQARDTVKDWQYQQSEATYVSHLNDLVAVPELDQLVQTALAHNPGLQQTALALKIAYADKRIAAADRLPTAAAGFSQTRAENAEDSYAAELTVSWELDLWHKLSDSVKAAEMDIAGSAAGYQAARDALAASVMRAWLAIIQQRQLITIEESRLQVLESNERLITQRYRSGLGDLEELDNARTSSASTRATLAQYTESLAQAERALRQLLGQQDTTISLPTTQDFPQVIQPLSLFPNQDLARRPDLQQAYYNIVAAQYQTEVAYKDLLPSISLSATLSDIGASAGDALFTSPAWSLLGQLTAPLFQGGKLKAQAEIAELTAEQQFWAYQETLLTAVTEVNDALGQEQALQQQQQHIHDALTSARRSVSSYEAKYRQGLVDILDLLTVQQQTFDLQSQLVQLIYNRLANRIDLGLALGLEAAS